MEPNSPTYAAMLTYGALVDLTALSIPGLLARCVDTNDPDAWEEFVRRFHSCIAGTVYKAVRLRGPVDKMLVEDLVQDTFLRLCANRCRALREFQADEESYFYGFLRATAVSAVHDHFRRQHTISRGGGIQPRPIDDFINKRSVSQDGEHVCHLNLTRDEIDRALRQRDPETADRDRMVFWLRFRNDLTARQIAALPSVGLTESGVESLLRRLVDELRDGMSATAGGSR